MKAKNVKKITGRLENGISAGSDDHRNLAPGQWLKNLTRQEDVLKLAVDIHAVHAELLG